MPLGRYRTCPTPGCSTLVPTGTGKCERCRPAARRKYDQARPSATARGYGAAWRQRRIWFLIDHPNCVDCDGPATVADHDPVPRVELLERGDPDPDAFHHLKPRCESCHNRRTARQEVPR
jgi:5-methylcytosine-specific restriction protein A